MSKKMTQNNPSHPQVPSGQQQESTLLPMLIGGLLLIVIGSVIVMTFV